MKTTLFTLITTLGEFWIRPEAAGRVQLGLDRRKLKSYNSVKAAVRAVADHDTGLSEWDTSESVAPADLRKWKRAARTSGHPAAKTRD